MTFGFADAPFFTVLNMLNKDFYAGNRAWGKILDEDSYFTAPDPSSVPMPAFGANASGRGSTISGASSVEEEEHWEPSRNGHTLLIAYFPRDSTSSSLRGLFEKFGDVQKLSLVRDEDGTSKCYAFVRFKALEEAVAVHAMCKSGLVRLPDKEGKVWYVKATWAKRRDRAMRRAGHRAR